MHTRCVWEIHVENKWRKAKEIDVMYHKSLLLLLPLEEMLKARNPSTPGATPLRHESAMLENWRTLPKSVSSSSETSTSSSSSKYPRDSFNFCWTGFPTPPPTPLDFDSRELKEGISRKIKQYRLAPEDDRDNGVVMR